MWAYDAEKGAKFPAAPKGLAAEGYFYSETTQYPTPASTTIENWFAMEIEGPGAEAINVLLEKKEMSGPQARAFFGFVAAQLQRTPTALQRATDLAAPMFQEMAERIIKFHPEARANIIAAAKARGETGEVLEDLIRLMDQGQIKVTPTRGFTIAQSLKLLEMVASELVKMKWIFADVPASDGDLILGDHPVTLADVGPSPAPLGIKNPNIELAMPLSPRTIALAHWDGPIAYGELAPGVAEELNRRTLSQAHRFAYASFNSDELLRQATTLRGTGPKIRMHRVQMGQRFMMISEFR